MKSIQRLMALLLCLLLAVSPACAALAEDAAEPVAAESAPADAAPEQGGGTDSIPADEDLTPPEETGAPESSDDPAAGDETPEAGETAAPGAAGQPGTQEAQPEPDEQGDSPAAPEGDFEAPAAPGAQDAPAPEEPVAPEIDTTQSAVFSAAFHEGYAALLGESAAYAGPAPEDDLVCTVMGGVVYALERSATSGADRLKCAFDWNGERIAWIDAAQLRPMSEEEAAAFVEERAGAQDVCYLFNALALPLDAVEVALPEQNTGSGESDAGEPSANDVLPAESEADAEAAVPPVQLFLNLEQDAFVLDVGESAPIEASFSDGGDYPIEYDAQNPEIATVSEDGTITAVAAGEANIALDGAFGTMIVSVSVQDEGPEWVELAAPRETLGVGEKLTLRAEFPEGTDGAQGLEYKSSAPEVAEVDGAGVVTGISAGKATITVTTANDKQAAVTLTVKAAPTSVAFDKASVTLGMSQTAKLAASLSKDSAGRIDYSIAPENIVDYDPETGVITPLGEGEATITAKTYNAVSDGVPAATCEVSVKADPQSVTFSVPSITVGVGETASSKIAFDGETEPWSGSYTAKSSNSKYASYTSATGAIKGKKVGSTTITVTSYNKQTATLKIAVKAAPSKVVLGAPRKTLGVGETVQLSVALPKNTASYRRTFTSSDESIATVSESGLVTAVDVGTATITVLTYNGKKSSVKITVSEAPTSVAFNQESLELGVGQKATVSATLSPVNVGDRTFSVNRPEILKVNEKTGAVEALAEGEATITVTPYNAAEEGGAKPATLEVTVKKAPTKVSFAQTGVTIGVGESYVLPDVILGAENEECMASYSIATKNKKIATYSGGIIKGKKVGTTYIVVTTHNKRTASFKVVVRKAPSKVVLGAPRKALGVGETVQLSVALPKNTATARRTFTSSDEGVAAVSESGLVTANSVGTATITVQTFNGKKSSVKITVSEAPTSVAFNQEFLELGVGQKATVSATLSPVNVGDRTFSVDEPTVLKVDAKTGAVEALAEGKATITVTPYNAKGEAWPNGAEPATLKVTVKKAPTKVSFAQTGVTIGVGESYVLPEVILGAENEECMASYSIATKNKKIATYSGGIIKGKKAGTTYIVVTTHNKRTASFKVVVRKAPSKVVLGAPRKTLGVGETVQLSVSLPKNTATARRTFSSSDEGVATVSESGLVTANDVGTATITVLTYNGKKSSIKITVSAAPESVAFNQESLELGVGQKATVSATLFPVNVGDRTFSVDEPTILKVNEKTGAVEALAEGKATITVTPYNAAEEGGSMQPSATLTVTVKPAPTEVSFEVPSITVGLGERFPVPPVVLGKRDESGKPVEKCMASYSIATKNKKIAAYSGGKVKGMKVGVTYLTVTTHNGKKGTLKVVVLKAPSKVSLSAPHTTLGVGEEINLTVALPKNTYSSTRSFSSSAPEVASVDAAGRVTAVSTGTAKITVMTYNLKKATVTITVVPAPESVSLPGELVLGAGEAFTITSTTMPEGSGGGRTYSVDNTSVATIDATTGKIKALKAGETTVRVVTYTGNDKAAECRLIVKNAPTGITLNNGNFTICAGDTFQLAEPTLQGTDVASHAIAYKSSKTACATVSATGLVRGVKAGSAKITVSSYNKTSKAITVTVKDKPKSIAFAEKAHKLFIGDEYTPKVNVSNSVPCTYSLVSDQPGIVKVLEDGKTLRALTAGTATITATSYNGKTCTMTITVPRLPAAGEVNFKRTPILLGAGDGDTLRVVMPEDAGSHLTFEVTKNPEVVSFEQIDNETIQVTALQKGEATIHVSTQTDGVGADAVVKVLNAPTALYVSPSSAVRSIDEERSLQLRWGFGADDQGGSVRFVSNNTGIATVDGDGLVSILKTGTVTITATTYNGHQANCTLTIGVTPTKMQFAQSEVEIALGDEIQLPVSFDKGCESYTLQADNSCVTVDGDVVKAVSEGSATLTATSNRTHLTATCTVNVVPAPDGIQADVERVDLVIGVNSKQQLRAQPTYHGAPSAGSVHYYTSDPKVATVDYATGLVTAQGQGGEVKDCTVYAVTYNGYVAKYLVHVSYLLEGAKIGIDPGHQAKGDMSRERNKPSGGSMKYKCASPGSGVARVREDKIDLQIGLKLRDALEALGATVYMTRTTANVNISNQQRAKMMNAYGVDLVLRIHADASSASSAHGMSLYRRKTCCYSNSQVDPAQGTAKNLMANEKRLSQLIGKYFTQQTGCYFRGNKTSDEYTMNNWSTVPCLLVEVGFMTNPTEGKLIVQDAYQNKMVRGIVMGICSYEGVPLPTEW